MSEDSDSSAEDECIFKESAFKFCIKCKGKLNEFKKGEDSKFLVCESDDCSFKMKVEGPSTDAKDRLTMIVKKIKRKRFKYCFRCGEEVSPVGDAKVLCFTDGCDMSFQVSAAIDTKPTEQSPQENVKKKCADSYEAAKERLEFPLSRQDFSEQKEQEINQDVKTEPTSNPESHKETLKLQPHGSDSVQRKDFEISQGGGLKEEISASSKDPQTLTESEEIITEVPAAENVELEPVCEHRSVDQHINNYGEGGYNTRQHPDKGDSVDHEKVPDFNTIQETQGFVLVQREDKSLPLNKDTELHVDQDHYCDSDDKAGDVAIISVEPVIEDLIPLLKPVDVPTYVRIMSIDEQKLREIEMLQSDEERWRTILKYQFSVDCPTVSLLSEIATTIYDMNHKDLAHDVKELSKEIKKRSVGSMTCVTEKTEWSEVCSEDDSISTLMLSRPGDILLGENLKKFICSSRLMSRPRVTYTTLVKDCVKVVFNALIPIEPWGWNDNSLVFVRFENEPLGGWKYDCGIFKKESTHSRYIQDSRFKDPKKYTSIANFVQVRIVFFIPEEVAKNTELFVYKYVLYTDKIFKEEREQAYWEYIPTERQYKEYVNRCFSIDRLHCRAHDTHEEFDQIIWPPVESMLPIPQFIGRWFKKEATAEDRFRISFDIYFQKYKDQLYSDYRPSKAFCADLMANLFSKLSSSWYCCNKEVCPEAASNCPVVSIDWVNKVAKALLDRVDVSPTFKTWKFCCGVTLLLFLKHIKISIDVKSQISCYKCLFRLLRPCVIKLSHHPTPKLHSEGIELLLGDTFNDRSALKEIVKRICSYLMEYDDNTEYEWLYGIIILHFLNKDVEPFKPYSNKLKVNQIRKAGLAGLTRKRFFNVMYRLQHDTESISVILQMCKPFMELDKLLIWTLLSLFPVHHYSTILLMYPTTTPIISEAFADYLSTRNIGEKHSLNSKIISTLTKTLTKSMAIQCDPQRFLCTYLEYTTIAQASIDIISSTIHEMTSSDDHLCCVTALLEMFLVTNAILKQHQEQTDTSASGIKGVTNEISRWLKSTSVVGEHPFGTGRSLKKEKLHTELKIWTRLSQVECPDLMKEDWSFVLQTVAEERVSKLKSKERLALLTKCQSQALPEDLQVIVGKFVLKDIRTTKHDTLKDEDYTCHLKSLAVGTKGKKNAQMILGEYIAQEFLDRIISLHSLLTWDMWPTFLMVYGYSSVTIGDVKYLCSQFYKKCTCNDVANALGQDGSVYKTNEIDHYCTVVTTWLKREDNCPKTCNSLASTLTEKLKTDIKLKRAQEKRICLKASAEELCENAVQLFRKICGQIVDKTVTIKDMEVLNDHIQEQVSGSADLSWIQSLHRHIYRRYVGFLPELECITTSLCQRLKEFRHFLEMKEKLQLLCDLCSDITSGGSNYIKAMLTNSSSREQLHEVCYIDNNVPYFPCFDISQEILLMLHSLKIMNNQYRTEIFSRMWKKMKDEIMKQNKMLSLMDVYHFLWKPIHMDCEAIVDGLNSLKIRLSVVQTTFGGMDPDKVTEEVKLLVKALSACRKYQNEVPLDEPSNESLQKIVLYNQLCDFHQAITCLSQLREMLGLTTTDLSSSQVLPNVSKEMELGVIDQSVINTELELLKEISEQTRRRKCIKAFCDNKELIDWIKKETESLAQLQNLVVIMQRSSAEGDDVNDLLADLVTVVSAFAPLIYERLDKDATNDELAQRCRLLWEALKNTPKMDELLISCGKNLEMFKYLSDTSAGDVKESTITQMEEYYKRGEYEIGVPDMLVHSLNEVVRLKVTGKRNEVISLEKLMDLHGKLVLIAGQRGTEVDRFLKILHHVQGISELLVQLHSIGYTKYIGFVVKFRCSTVELQKLESVYEEMKQDFTFWSSKCDKFRNKCSQLNYFTSEQLLYLQKELAAINLDLDTLQCSVKLLTLLQSLNPNVDSKIVLCSMKNAKESMQLQQLPNSNPSIFPQKSLLSQQRLQNLTQYQRKLCKELKEDAGFKMGLVIRGLGEVAAVTTDSPLNILRQWCISMDKEKCEDASSAIMQLNKFQKELVEALEKEQYPKAVIVNGLFTKNIKENPKDILYKWCIANESEVGEDDEDIPQEESDVNDRETPSLSTVIDDKHPLVIQLLKDDAGYTLETAIKSVSACGENATIESVQKAASLISDGIEVSVEPLTVRKTWVESLAQKYTTSFVLQWGDYQNDFLELETLGQFLQELSHMSTAKFLEQQDSIDSSDYLRGQAQKIIKGCPNLIITEQECMWQTVLSLYYNTSNAPLPSLEQVLICTSETTIEEVILLWRRAVQNVQLVFSLVHAERLSFSVCEKALQQLDIITQGQGDCTIVIICAKGCQESSHVLSRLASYERECVNIEPAHLKEYIARNMEVLDEEVHQSAASVDNKNLLCGVVYSKRPGMGKSLYIQRLKEKLAEEDVENKQVLSRIPIHGPSVSPSTIMKLLVKECLQDPSATFKQIVHLDVSHSVLPSVDSLLFSLVVLRGLIDRHGNIWRHQRSQYIAIECTLSDVNFHETKWKSQSGVGDSLYLLLSLFPAKLCVSPIQCVEEEFEYQDTTDELRSSPCCVTSKGIIMMDEGIRQDEHFQRVYQYARRLEAKQNLDKFRYDKQRTEGESDRNSSLQLILKLLDNDRTRTPSWSEISHFLMFLSKQLKDCENSIYCQRSVVEDGLPHFKEFVIKFMLQMSKEFTSPSLKIAQDGKEGRNDSELEEQYRFSEQHIWLNQKHPYLFFNEDCQSFTFIGFRISEEGHLLDDESTIIKSKVMNTTLYQGLKAYGVNFQEVYSNWTTDQMLMKLANVLGCISGRSFVNPDPTYVLTYDNLMKMLAIHMRFRCNIPVIMMGETGCGKTRLLRYLCEVHARAYDSKVRNLLCLKVHGGVTNNVIKAAVNEAKDLAKHNEKCYNKDFHTVLFFDEVNTTESLELIKEVMCDRHLNGEPITENIKFAAACNPYRKHKPNMLKKLTSAGLGFYNTYNMQNIGDLKPYQLVYQVLKLPPSMLPLVYDFGQISGETEQKYIKEIVHHTISNSKVVQNTERCDGIKVITSVLCWCQEFMREQEDECSFVSLRDIVRALIVFEWFLEKLTDSNDLLNKLIREKEEQLQPLRLLTKALLYSVAVCYHARLSNRKAFENGVAHAFSEPYAIPEGRERFISEVERIESVFLESMDIPENIASNFALRENVFMMVVCIENRLPLFLVGKPGSSKSLAKTVVLNSMLGQQSRNKLLKSLIQVQASPYQCSQYSTAESISEVFDEARKQQDRMQKYSKGSSKFVSVVVLEEVGLAESAPNFPLKALHPYLEDGTSGQNLDNLEIEREKRVAFIGISNWALDPAKMNRGIMITRTPPDENELIATAKGISQGMKNFSHREYLCTHLFEPLSQMYMSLCKAAHESASEDELLSCREFFGLRDFYSLIKMICSLCEQHETLPTWSQLEFAIRRNFSGLAEVNPIDDIEVRILEELKLRCTPESDVKFNCSQLGLIQSSLKTYSTRERADDAVSMLYDDNRFLLFITENNSALHILETNLLVGKAPFILYGSSFPRDHEYAQVCRNINQIKLQMESGRPVILLNLETIYESLYDLLNQCYTVLPRGRYIDLGMRSHRIRCRVHEDFRLIIIADRLKVFSSFPSALINRLEKHFVLSSTILDEELSDFADKLSSWAVKFSKMSDSRHQFCQGDAFVGFQSDTVSSVVLHVNQLQRDGHLPCKTMEDSCKYFLLQLASHDAIARLSLSSLGENTEEYEFACNTYFEEQNHSSLDSFLHNYIHFNNSVENECLIDSKGRLFQVTTYGLLLNSEDQQRIASHLKIKERDIKLLMLREFDTEMAFSQKIRNFFKNESSTHRLLIIQCDNGHENIDLIACARYRTKDERSKQQSYGVTHVVFVVQLPRMNGGTKFPSFQGGPWISTHIDDLHGNDNATNTIKQAIHSSMSSFFKEFCLTSEESSIFHPISLLSGCIHKALAQLMSAQFSGRAEQLIEIMFQLISRSTNAEAISEVSEIHQQFLKILFERVYELLLEKEKDSYVPEPRLWAIKEALNSQSLRFGYTLVNSLASKIQESLVEILVYLLLRLDVNQNLDLFVISNSDSLTSQLWLGIFEDRSILSLQYKQLFQWKQSRNVSIYKYRFIGRFPFSSEVITQLDKSCSAIPASSEGRVIYSRLCDTLNGHPIGKPLSQISARSEELPDLRDKYLEDFLCTRALGSNDIHKIFKQALHSVMLSLRREEESLLEEVAAIHVAYQMIKTEVYWFVQLSQIFPDVIHDVPSAEVSMLYSGGEMLLHWDAMNCVLDRFIPNTKNLTSHQDMKDWVQKVYLVKNIAESILSSRAEGSQAKKISIICERKWSRIQTMHLLLQHVLIKLPSDLPNFKMRAYRVYKLIDGESTNFGDETMLNIILNFVIKPLSKALRKHKSIPELMCASCERKTGIDETLQFPCEQQHLICDKCYDDMIKDGFPNCPKCREHSFVSNKPFLPNHIRMKLLDYSGFQQHCRNFFIEFVSQICFSELLTEKPGKEFVRHLLSIAIASDSEDYEELFPINEASKCGKKCRIIRSFLLQLLIELRPTETRELLKEFMKEGKSFVGVEQLIRDDIHLLLLCAKSSERMFFKEFLTKHTLIERMEFATKVLKEARKILCNEQQFKHHRDDIDQDYIDSIAKARFGFSVAAETLHDYVYTNNSFITLPVAEKVSVEQMIVCTKYLCQHSVSVVRTNVMHFLIKQIVQRYGYSCFMEMSKSDQFQLKSWLLPRHSVRRVDTEVEGDLDPYVIYGGDYTGLREKLVYAQKTITTYIEEEKISEEALSIIAMFALHKKIQLQVPTRSCSEQNVVKVLHELKHQIHQCQLFSDEIRGAICVHNTGLPLTVYEFSPRERFIERHVSELVVHSVGVLVQAHHHPLLSVLSLPIHQPKQLQKVYLPSMPEELLDQAIKLMINETLWECPNGHKYFIGDCGRPWTKTKCPAPNCGAEIGGFLHKASHQTTKIEKEALKFTSCGHILGPANKRQINADKERKLSAISQSVIRILLHSSYFWALLQCDEDMALEISKSITPSVSVKELLDYFWHHLEKDVDILSFILQRNEVDASLLVHSILHEMLNVEIDLSQENDYSCLSNESRLDWENEFSKMFIQPFTDNDLSAKLNVVQATIISDCSQGMSEIFRIVSEKESMERVDDIDVQVWSYNPTITPALLEERLSNQDNMPYQLLLEFLKKEKHLRALQFLPDIVEMVAVLDEVCSYRLDRKTAKAMPISSYSKDYLPVEHRQRGFDKLVKSFCEAWNIVKDSLEVPPEYKRLQCSEKSKLEYFVPTKQEAGICCLQLINFLANLQNRMIETSWNKADEYGTSNRDYVVPLNKLQKCHVINHTKHLEHVILSHCSYSLLAGHGSDIEYDFAAMERHVLDAFLQGKPCISPSTVPAIMYRNDAQKTSVFQVVREQITQVSLSQQDKYEIIAEVMEKHQLAKTIEVVNTALGFLTVNTWSNNAYLCRYAHEVLKFGENVFTLKIKRKCTIAHAISLWKVLSVQQGLAMAIANEDPFPDVNDIFKVELGTNDISIINDGLRKCDQNEFLESLYEFITTYVQYLQADDEEHDFGMVERFGDIAYMYKIDQITNFDEENFPSTITLSKVVRVWAHAARYYVKTML